MESPRKSLDGLKINRPASSGGSARFRGWVVSVIVVLLLGVAAFWWMQRPRPITVRTTVARVVTGDTARTLLNASGYVTARREATVSSKVTGRVIEVLVEEGMKVEQDQILARLDDVNVAANHRLAVAQLEAARSALGEVRASLEQAERDLVRTRQLAAEQVVSSAELEQAESAVEVLKARLERARSDVGVAQSQVALWQQQLDDNIIRAPFAGVVTSKNAQPGEMISPISAGGGFTRTGICTIVDMSSLEVEVDVNETYINRVREGQPVVATLDSYPDWPIPARVIAIIPTADRQKATVRVRVGFEQLDPRILPDMGLKVAFQSTGDDGGASAAAGGSATAAAPTRQVVVPTAAVHAEGGRDVVWIVRNGAVERRAVTLGLPNGREVAVLGGLSGGETLVVDGPDTLTDGALVTEQQS